MHRGKTTQLTTNFRQQQQQQKTNNISESQNLRPRTSSCPVTSRSGFRQTTLQPTTLRPGTSLQSARNHRNNIENEMIKKREKEMQHQLQWGGAVKYYENFERNNNKYEEWTSPRYYQSNTQQWEELQKTRAKEERVERRREKLLKLYAEEEKSHQIELMVKNRDKFLTPRQKPDDIPTEVLKEINNEFKVEENDRRRHEAELKLYHQWRNDNPVVKHYERMRNLKDTKLSWLDQQIEKRMDREKKEEECRKMLSERDRKLKEEKLKEEAYKREIEAKNEELKKGLEEQIEALQLKQKESEELKVVEDEELAKRIKFIELDEIRKENEKIRKEREVALFNIRQHRQKLKQRAVDIRENLRVERELIENLRKFEILEQMRDEEKKKELRDTMKEFLKFSKEQEELEVKRLKHFESLFESESKAMFERQEETWRMEEAARKKLLEDIMESIKEQIEDNVKKNKDKQKELVKEREDMLVKMEEFNEEMEWLKSHEVEKKIEFRNKIDEQIRDRSRRKLELEKLERRNVDKELEKIRKEEERLKNEIMHLQTNKMPCYRRGRSKLWM